MVNRRNSLLPNLNDMVKIDHEKESKTNRKRAFSSPNNNSINSIPLSIQDERHLELLEMTKPLLKVVVGRATP